MKKILLIGDSLRAGYMNYVKMAFEGIAEVIAPEDSGRFASYVYRSLIDYKRVYGTDFDLIHWNCGLWDCLIMHDGRNFSTLEVYKDYMDRACGSMKMFFPNAKYIFANSTYVIEEGYGKGGFRRKNADIEAYNAAAEEIVKRHGMTVNDLYTVSKALPESAHSDMTHYYTKEGTEALTNRVIAVIEDALGIKAKPIDYDALFAEKKDVHGI